MTLLAANQDHFTRLVAWSQLASGSLLALLTGLYVILTKRISTTPHLAVIAIRPFRTHDDSLVLQVKNLGPGVMVSMALGGNGSVLSTVSRCSSVAIGALAPDESRVVPISALFDGIAPESAALSELDLKGRFHTLARRRAYRLRIKLPLSELQAASILDT